MIAVQSLTHVLAALNAATIVALLYAYGRIRAKDREGHRRAMFVAIAIGAAFLAVYLVYHAFAGLAKFGGEGPIRTIYFSLLAVHVAMAAVVTVLVPLTVSYALKGRYGVHRRLARVTLPSWLFVAVSGLVVYGMAVHLYPTPASVTAEPGMIQNGIVLRSPRSGRLALVLRSPRSGRLEGRSTARWIVLRDASPYGAAPQDEVDASPYGALLEDEGDASPHGALLEDEVVEKSDLLLGGRLRSESQ